MRMIRTLLLACLVCLISLGMAIKPVAAYPFYAQMSYENPREATGKIVCANCHLAQMPTQLEIPQGVTPGQVFEAVVKIPYDTSIQQISGDGEPVGLNVGAVLILPEGFRLANEEEMTPEQLEEVEDTYITPYSEEQPNILLVGPLPGDEYQEIAFPIKVPDPNQDASVNFLKYQVFVGGNRGRGQLNPDGSLSNNNVFRAPVSGTILEILELEDPFFDLPEALVDLVDVGDGYPGTRVITLETEAGLAATAIPPGPELIVSVGENVDENQALTANPNVGGFGQVESDIVLQDPNRIKWLLAFLGAIIFTQIMLVLKKKQVEMTQAAELMS